MLMRNKFMKKKIPLLVNPKTLKALCPFGWQLLNLLYEYTGRATALLLALLLVLWQNKWQCLCSKMLKFLLAHLSRRPEGAYSIGRLRRPSVFRPQIQMTSPLKLMGQLQPNFIYSLQGL